MCCCRADFYNLTNRGNMYSNPNTNATIDYVRICTARTAGEIGFNCSPLPSLAKLTRPGRSLDAGLHQPDRSGQHAVRVPGRS